MRKYSGSLNRAKQEGEGCQYSVEEHELSFLCTEDPESDAKEIRAKESTAICELRRIGRLTIR